MSIQLSKIAKEYKKRARKKLDSDYRKVINYTNTELYKEVTQMFDTFIDQFYSYPTKQYVRHGQTRAGTRNGLNLYRGQQISKKDGINPLLIIDFSGEDMQGENYTWDAGAPGHVLDLVMHGIRFPIGNGMSWHGMYEGKYFSYYGTTAQAFQEFGRDFKRISSKLFYDEWYD